MNTWILKDESILDTKAFLNNIYPDQCQKTIQDVGWKLDRTRNWNVPVSKWQ